LTGDEIAVAEADSREGRRTFIIAFLIAGATMLCVGYFVVVRDLVGLEKLGTLVSGWIGAIIGFYFSRHQAMYAAGAGRASASRANAQLEIAVERVQSENDRLKTDLRILGRELIYTGILDKGEKR